MKKIVYFAAIAITALLTACSNDDIEVAYGVNVKVDPSGVISPFNYEISAGELESFSTAYKLRVRVMAYDQEGSLKAQDVAYLTNYRSVMNSSLNLAPGKYTLLTITDVVGYSSGTVSNVLWNLSGEEQLQTAKVTSASKRGYKNEILGIGSKQVTITEGSTEVTLNPTPAGALLLTTYWHIHHFSDITELKIQANRLSDFVTFDGNGNQISTPQNSNNQFNWRIDWFNPKDDSSTNVYSYHFMFPMENVSFRYVYSTATETNQTIFSDNMVISRLNAGDEYWFELDLYNEDDPNSSYYHYITYAYYKVNGSSSARQSVPLKLKQEVMPLMFAGSEASSAHIADLITSMP